MDMKASGKISSLRGYVPIHDALSQFLLFFHQKVKFQLLPTMIIFFFEIKVNSTNDDNKWRLYVKQKKHTNFHPN